MFSIANLTNESWPDDKQLKTNWQKIKEDILGKKYSLSLVFAPPEKMREINKQCRQKDKACNTLSFLLTENEGEIFLNVKEDPENIFSLFIHSLLHLKGFEHSDKMDKEEEKYLKKYNK